MFGCIYINIIVIILAKVFVLQADIFSFGLTLYMLLMGRHPFHYMESRGEMDRAISEVQ